MTIGEEFQLQVSACEDAGDSLGAEGAECEADTAGQDGGLL